MIAHRRHHHCEEAEAVGSKADKLDSDFYAKQCESYLENTSRTQLFRSIDSDAEAYDTVRTIREDNRSNEAYSAEQHSKMSTTHLTSIRILIGNPAEVQADLVGESNHFLVVHRCFDSTGWF
jgi:hypothetical protein